ncbi:hypothetical protein QUF70_15800 [Desulfobacterales bacterium HSG17]|nr:hypothetical protein [Desulfobacterales bacterium HSG17]
MKKVFVICFFSFLLQTSCFAKDFILEFVEENYQETRSSFSYSPIIYHSIQARSETGPKLLVLIGDDFHRRKWLRQYIGESKEFIAKVPDDMDDLFISSKAFEIDVTSIHPFDLALYRKGEEDSKQGLGQFRWESDVYKSNRKEMKQKTSRLESTKSNLKKNLIEQRKKQQQENTLKKAQQEKDKSAENEKKRLEKEELLKASEEQREAEELKLNEELEKIKAENDLRLTILAERRAAEDTQRREELEQRWIELKKRLLKDDRIKNLEQAERRKEIQRRWIELRQSYE